MFDDALHTARLPFSFEALKNAQIATGAQDARLSGSAEDDLFVGTSANETFFGGQGGDFYFLNASNFGQDRIVETTARQDEGAPDVIVLPEGVGRDGFAVERTATGFVLTLLATSAQVAVENRSFAGADGDFGVEVVRLFDGTEFLVADLLGVFNVEAGANALVAEGGTFERTVVIDDPGLPPPGGWTSRAEWSDGVSTSGVVAPADPRFVVTRTFPDGNTTVDLLVTVGGAAGATDTDRVRVSVVNVAPTAAVTGANTVIEGRASTR